MSLFVASRRSSSARVFGMLIPIVSVPGPFGLVFPFTFGGCASVLRKEIIFHFLLASFKEIIIFRRNQMESVTTKQLSEMTGRHAKTLARWARGNVIPGVFVGGPVGWLFDFSAVDSALKKHFGNRAQKALMRRAVA